MTWKFGANFNLSPTVGTPNVVLETAASELAMIYEFNFGGEVTTSTAMRTSVFRAAEGVGAATAITIASFAENAPTALIAATQGDHATTPAAPVLPGMWGTSWNAHGGVIRWLANPGEEIIMLGVSTVILENEAGTAQSHYGFVWGEY